MRSTHTDARRWAMRDGYNVTYFVEQISAVGVGTDHYVVNFHPETLLPDVTKR